MDRINGFVRFNFAQLIVQRDGIARVFQEGNNFRVANSFAHNRNGNALHAPLADVDLRRDVGAPLLRRNLRLCGCRGDRLYSNTLMFGCNQTPNRSDDALHIGQRSVLIDGIVTDHDVGFTDENRRTDHRIPELGRARDVGNNHLPHTAVLGVFLHNKEPASFVH